MRNVRIPSTSGVKREAVEEALKAVWPNDQFTIQCHAVELQDRPDMSVDAQPEGRELTIRYAQERGDELKRQQGETEFIDVLIESGAIDGRDVAVVIIRTHKGEEKVILSEGVPFPQGTLEEARRVGFKTTTAGDIIHERWPSIPSNSWQQYFWPGLSRKEQIRNAVIEGLQQTEIS